MLEIKITIEELPNGKLDIQALVPHANGTDAEVGLLRELINTFSAKFQKLGEETGAKVKQKFIPLPEVQPGQNTPSN